MPEFRQYPQAVSLNPTDAFLIERVNIGTMYIEAQDMEFSAGYDGYDIFAQSDETFFPLVFNAVRPFTLPINFYGSKFSMITFPFEPFVLDVYQNASLIGTITINTTSIVANIPDECTFNIGDQLKLLMSDGGVWLHGGSVFSMTLKGTRII